MIELICPGKIHIEGFFLPFQSERLVLFNMSFNGIIFDGLCKHTNYEFLKDTYDWALKKRLSIQLADSYHRIGCDDKATSVLNCGSYLQFRLYDNGDFKLHQANFCKVRLCPMCSWRRSLKIFAQVSKVMEYLSDDYNYLFLTLTVRNCSGDELSNVIDDMFIGLKSFFKYKAIKQVVKGYFRCLEVTHNWEDDSYHPHFHMVLVVDKSYFNQSRIYLSQREWVEYWRRAMNLDYTPICDIRRFRESDKGIGKEVAEVSKYAVKSADIFYYEFGKVNKEKSDPVVELFDSVLAGRRLVSFGGVMKQVHARCNLDDFENGDLIHVDGETLRADIGYIVLTYLWNVGASNYIKCDI